MAVFKKPEEPRPHHPPERYTIEGIPPAIQTPDEPVESERAVRTPTRTIRDGEIQGHPREMPGDRDSE
jgi:hypothetical protein